MSKQRSLTAVVCLIQVVSNKGFTVNLLFNPFPNDKFKTQMTFINFMKMAEKFSKLVENTVGKG